MRFGIKSVTMDDIARELGISKKTLYQHFENKADLIRQVVYLHIQLETEAMQQIRLQSENAVHEIMQIAQHIVQLFRSHSPTIVFDLQKYYRDSWQLLESLNRKHIYRIIRENLEWGIREGLYRDNLNPDIIAKLYVGKSALVVDEAHFPLSQYNRAELFRSLIAYHLCGIVSDKGREVMPDYLPCSNNPSN